MSSKKKREQQAKSNARYAKRRQQRLARVQAPQKTGSPPYTVDDLLDSRNQGLYKKVNASSPVVLTLSDDDSWGSKLTKENKAEIYYAYPSDAPKECFAHELLHMKFEQDGLRCPGVVDDDEVMGNRAPDWVRQLYNDFMHHKMYPLYSELGYSPDKFLADSDFMDSAEELETQIGQFEKEHQQKIEPVRNLRVATAYMMTKNPHDTDAGNDFDQFRYRINKIADAEMIQGIDALLAEWKNTPKPDCRIFMARFFRLCGYPNVGFGYNEHELIWAKDV